ncbi:excinuclease ABC subunit B [Haemophilus parahaemolyticus HK385]|uniref:Uncharacterized protein n=1 Tax=Haemophilus parahaemolyticus HK385 TaxID=1095744 RepID=A0ABP2P4C2_HAEPH|nr:hypothetical protein HMPREF1050_0175 [Haemophilus parahaemolyticus HK385]STO66385.1 excinuclease ABC subunit B [Haemophilus parahaemolyticus HK385]
MKQSTPRKGHSLLFPLFIFVVINLIVFSLSRLSLGLWQAERVNAVDGWSQLILQGFRIDVSALCWLFGLPALFSVLLLSNNVIGKIWQAVLRIWLTVGSVFILFMEVATPNFIETFDLRPNRLFIEYLTYQKKCLRCLFTGI